MMELTAKIVGGYNREELRVFRRMGSYDVTVEFLTVDRTHYGPEWCRNHGMEVVGTVKADNGELFEIWKKGNELACAIPEEISRKVLKREEA